MPSTTEYVEWIKEHYIMLQKKYILQRQDGQGYSTLTYDKHKTKLNDSLIRKHLKQEITLGCFAGQYLNKFVCFDIDCKEQSRELAYRLVECLTEQYGLRHNQILVSFSGSKGYHVEIFFKDAISITYLKTFYQLVIEELGADKTEIEFRNTYHQAVKIPLSINRKTGKKCYLVDTETLEELGDEHLFTIETVDMELFKEQIDEIWDSKPFRVVKNEKVLIIDTNIAEEFEQVIANVNLDLTIDYQARIIQMLESNSLLYPSSRHNSTLLLGAFFMEQGYEQEEAQELVYSLMLNTWHTARHLISNDTTLEFIEAETARLVDIVYKKGYKLGSTAKRPVRITKEDILFILKPKKLHLRQLLFTMLCHSKRHSGKDGSFYMTYKQMAEMGNTTDRGRLAKYIDELQKEGCLDVLRRNERKEKSHLSKPNIYRMAHQIAHVDAEFVELETIKAEDFGRVTAQLLSESELKQVITKNQFYKVFKEYYTA